MKATQFRDNYIKAIRLLMVEKGLDELKQMAEFMGMGYMSLYKIMTKAQNPTARQMIALCLKGGYSANWMLLNKGEMKLTDTVVMTEIKQLLQKRRV